MKSYHFQEHGWAPRVLHVGCKYIQIGEGNGSPLQYSCLENPMDGGAWWATVHRVAKSWTRLSDFTFTLFQSPLRMQYFNYRPSPWKKKKHTY